MGAYKYIPNGSVVQVADGKTLPSALFEPVEQPKKAAPKGKTKKPKSKE